MNRALYFTIPFFTTFLFFRAIIYLISKPLSEIAEHTPKGARFHHLHYGIMILFLGILHLLTFGAGPLAFMLMGTGLGMVLDEFIPSLFIPAPEPYTSRLYRNSFFKTSLLFIAVTFLILALSIFSYG